VTSARDRKRTADPAASQAPGSSSARACGWLLTAAGLTLGLASILHSGISVPLGVAIFRDSFRGAAIPEAVLGVLCLIGGAAVLALLGTAYGLTDTLGGDRPGDVAYHLGLLGLLFSAGALLLRGDVRRLLTGVGPLD
jgi:hypothetical protein